MKSTSGLTVAVLAGGKSRRFGSPKYLAPFHSGTLLDSVIHTASQISDHIILIAGQLQFSPAENIPLYKDIYLDCGPLGGIYTALHYSADTLLAILPCDMPLMDAATYHILRDRISPGHPVAALSHRGLEPLVSIWPVQPSLPVVAKNLERGKYSICKTLQELKATTVDFQVLRQDYRPEIFSNINYPTDLLQVEAYREHRYELG